MTGIVRIDLADPDAADNVGNAIAGVTPLRSPSGALSGDDPGYESIRTAMDLAIVALFGAVGTGLGLGAALLRVAGAAPTVPWTNIAVVCATAFGVVLGTTAASLPALGRLMRPGGLRVG
ncbi:hypothetical protein [Parafrankia discariae]|uniref:hypothetical protein n=1 Tax=Parafrankia discariae TaxID=365528 RepID=UPI00036B612E|nr:hypothetical protein [Parafrankia discariae]